MLGFFRRNQRIFFLFTTVIVTITFAFFGTNQTRPRSSVGDELAFTTVTGERVTRQDIQNMTLFLGTDSDDQKNWQIAWGPNFLNDGVIKRDFLTTGLAQLMAAEYMDELAPSLNTRLQKERRYKPYSHPEATFLSAKTTWAYYAPHLREAFDNFQQRAMEVSKEESFDMRVKLYIEERRFPSTHLRQALLMQEQQFAWIPKDQQLMRTDLDLYGYRTVEDWFGRQFVELASQFVFNAAAIAESRGYYVSSEEAMADLIRQSALSFDRVKGQSRVGVANSKDYFKEQLRRLGMDQSTAVSLWQKVMLFRRLFEDVGNTIFVDALSYEKFQNYANETTTVDLYQLPKALQFSTFNELQQFETYLQIVAPKVKGSGKDLLAIPNKFFPVDEIAKRYPEMVSHRYLLNIAEVDRGGLQTKVGVKATWDWQLEEANWKRLQKEFPELGLVYSSNRDDRFTALDQLDETTRARLDSFAREEIVEKHPEWVDEAFETAQEKVLTVNMRLKGEIPPFTGIKDVRALMRLLDQAAAVQDESSIGDAMTAAEELLHFYSDDNKVYRIVVLDRDSDKGVLSFAEAKRDGTLQRILDDKLKLHYEKMKKGSLKSELLDDKGTVLPFAKVETAVAENLFAPVIRSVYNDFIQLTGEEASEEKMSGIYTAPRRFFYFMRTIENALKATPEKEEQFLAKAIEPVEGSLSQRKTLLEQWKLQKLKKTLPRNDQSSFNADEAFALSSGSWSKVSSPIHGDVYFFKVLGREVGDNLALEAKMQEGQEVLSNEAKRLFMQDLLEQIKAKGAISLSTQKIVEEGE